MDHLCTSGCIGFLPSNRGLKEYWNLDCFHWRWPFKPILTNLWPCHSPQSYDHQSLSNASELYLSYPKSLKSLSTLPRLPSSQLAAVFSLIDTDSKAKVQFCHSQGITSQQLTACFQQWERPMIWADIPSLPAVYTPWLKTPWCFRTLIHHTGRIKRCLILKEIWYHQTNLCAKKLIARKIHSGATVP